MVFWIWKLGHQKRWEEKMMITPIQRCYLQRVLPRVFDSALSLVINTSEKETGKTSVEAKVSLGQTESGNYLLGVELLVNIPGIPIKEAQELMEKANEICPYSIATSNNIEVKLAISNS